MSSNCSFRLHLTVSRHAGLSAEEEVIWNDDLSNGTGAVQDLSEPRGTQSHTLEFWNAYAAALFYFSCNSFKLFPSVDLHESRPLTLAPTTTAAAVEGEANS